VPALLLLLLLAACGSASPAAPASSPPTASPTAPARLALSGQWSWDDLHHREPLVVHGVRAAVPDTLLLVLVASDSGQGPARGGPPLDGGVARVTGGGLHWTCRAAAHLSVTGEPRVAEVWSAFTSVPLAPFTVTVHRSDKHGANTLCDNYQGGSGPDIADGMLVVQAFTGVDPARPIGATAVAGSGPRSGGGRPAVALATTAPGSLVEAVGSDWTAATHRRLPLGERLLHEDRSRPNDDDYWVQAFGLPVATVRRVRLFLLAPRGDDCNLAAVEIRPAP
jgi:hypothetical protein